MIDQRFPYATDLHGQYYQVLKYDENTDPYDWDEEATFALMPTVEHVDVPVSVPVEVSARQLMIVLLEMGLLDQIEQFVATQDKLVQLSWNKTSMFRRDNVLLNQMAEIVGLSSEQIDEIFINANNVE